MGCYFNFFSNILIIFHFFSNYFVDERWLKMYRFQLSPIKNQLPSYNSTRIETNIYSWKLSYILFWRLLLALNIDKRLAT